MHVRELRPRLWHWTARHPDWAPAAAEEESWDPGVSSYAYAAPADHGPAALVLFDPLVPAGGAGGLWRWLDAEVGRHGPPHVLVTIFWHVRGAPAVLERYAGARVWAYAPARDEIARRTAVTDVFAPGEPLPAGVQAGPVGGSGHEVCYRVPEHDAVVVGDAMIARAGQPPRVWPDDESVRTALRRLLDRPLELLLLAHGEPVTAGGRDALARALA